MRNVMTAIAFAFLFALLGVGFLQGGSEAPAEPPPAEPPPAQEEGEQDPLLAQALQIFEPIPLETPVLEENPYTEEKNELGKALWFDPRLSSSWFISCNSCHNLGTAGVDLQPRSIVLAWQRGGRNSPADIYAAFNLAQF